MHLTHERATELFRYDADTGKLFWKIDKHHIKAGTEAGCIFRRGHLTYRHIMVDGKKAFAHRIIWLMIHGAIDDALVIDHLDGDGLNNRIENLRLVTQSSNARNTRMYKNNTSGFKGVNYRKDRDSWRAYVFMNGKETYVGSAKTPEAASHLRTKYLDEYGYIERAA